MALQITCRRCKEELNEQGGLLFAPPKPEWWDDWASLKYHLCNTCFVDVLNYIDGEWDTMGL